MSFSMDLIRRLDDKMAESTLQLIGQRTNYRNPWPILLDLDCEDSLPALAELWNIPLHMVCKYQELRRFIDCRFRGTLDEFGQTLEDLATDLEMEADALEAYIDKEVAEIKDAWDTQDDKDGALASRIAAQSLSPLEWE